MISNIISDIIMRFYIDGFIIGGNFQIISQKFFALIRKSILMGQQRTVVYQKGEL